jgi:pimeloyl-ACP methyl ester carboxylesterase
VKTLATHRVPGLVLSDLEFQVPLDYAQPGGDRIGVFARAVTALAKEQANLPWLVFFQGGPGLPAPRPTGPGGWMRRALQEYRVLLLDGRGTGLSTPLTFQTLAHVGSPQQQAAYLKHFRADSIVRDAEFIRCELLGEDGRWSVLGQSFGGFCVTHYLSAAPGHLDAAIMTGGLPPLDRPVDDIYKGTYPRVSERNRRYYERYPGDVELARDIATYLAEHDVRLPGGGRLTPRRFQQIGGAFGSPSGPEDVHYMLEGAFVDSPGGRELGFTFLRRMEQSSGFETNPIYALLHEAEYCQDEASNWSAERVRAQFPEFAIAPDLPPDRPVYFTGEMVYPWMFDDFAYLRPLMAAADILAADADWPRLYDIPTLNANTVPCAAAVYYNDMYVERIYSEETARQIRGIKAWVTSEYEHGGLRMDGERVLGRLLDLLRGEIAL